MMISRKGAATPDRYTVRHSGAEIMLNPKARHGAEIRCHDRDSCPFVSEHGAVISDIFSKSLVERSIPLNGRKTIFENLTAFCDM